jgi:hypothetical protein
VNPQLIDEIVALIAQGGPVVLELFLKLESLLNLGPDEKQNIANAIAASNAADQDTIARVTKWMADNGMKPTFLPAQPPAVG